MSRLPVGAQVECLKGQPGIVVRATTSLWPTLTPVKWVGASFVTYEDHHKLTVVSLPAGDKPLSPADRVMRMPPSQKRREAARDAHAALLERARLRSGSVTL